MSQFMRSLEKRLEDPEFRAGYEESQERRRTPIDRAEEALMRNRAYQAGVAFGVPDETEAEAKHRSEIVKAVFDSIDTDQLTAIILRTELPGGIKVGHADKIAQAIKNWLTGKDTK